MREPRRHQRTSGQRMRTDRAEHDGVHPRHEDRPARRQVVGRRARGGRHRSARRRDRWSPDRRRQRPPARTVGLAGLAEHHVVQCAALEGPSPPSLVPATTGAGTTAQAAALFQRQVTVQCRMQVTTASSSGAQQVRKPRCPRLMPRMERRGRCCADRRGGRGVGRCRPAGWRRTAACHRPQHDEEPQIADLAAPRRGCVVARWQIDKVADDKLF